MCILRSNQCGAKTYNSKLCGSPLELTQWWWPGGGGMRWQIVELLIRNLSSVSSLTLLSRCFLRSLPLPLLLAMYKINLRRVLFILCFQILHKKLDFLHRHLSRGQRNKLKDKLAPEPPNGRMCFTLKLSCSWQFIANHTY